MRKDVTLRWDKLRYAIYPDGGGAVVTQDRNRAHHDDGGGAVVTQSPTEGREGRRKEPMKGSP